MRYLIILGISIFWVGFTSVAGHTAEFLIETFTLPSWSSVPDENRVDGIFVDGPIEKGDSKKFEQTVRDFATYTTGDGQVIFDPNRILRVRLDSTGGDVDEALVIANFVAKWGIATYVGENNSCLSACAFIFMSGWHRPYEGPGWVQRKMHKAAVLGFHAPRLKIAGCLDGANGCGTDYVRVQLNDIYSEYAKAMVHIAGLLSEEKSALWQSSLVAEMLTVSGPDDFVYIDTVDKAGRWDIEVEGVNPPQVDGKNAGYACLNLYRWSDPHHWIEYNWFDDDEAEENSDDWVFVPDGQWSNLESGQLAANWMFDRMNVQSCSFRAPFEDGEMWSIGYGGEKADDWVPIPWIAFFRGNMPLRYLE